MAGEREDQHDQPLGQSNHAGRLLTPRPRCSAQLSRCFPCPTNGTAEVSALQSSPEWSLYVRMSMIGKWSKIRNFTWESHLFRGGAPGAARTRNLRLRRPSLYPVELPARMDPEHNAI